MTSKLINISCLRNREVIGTLRGCMGNVKSVQEDCHEDVYNWLEAEDTHQYRCNLLCCFASICNSGYSEVLQCFPRAESRMC
jgi:hypothetical protein